MFASLPVTPLEMTDSLEQLRAIEHGYAIRMARIAAAPIGVDTEEDLRGCCADVVARGR